MIIKEFTKGQVLSRTKLNELVKWLNLLLNAIIKRGGNVDRLYVSESNIIYQLAKGGVGSGGGGMNYMGEWDSATAYVAGDVVRVSPSNTISTTQTGGVTLPGVYVCTNDNTGTEPANPLQTGGENNYWDWLSTWPSEITVCVNGVDVTYIIDGQEKP